MRVRTKRSLLLLIALTVALSLLGGNAWATEAKESAATVVDEQVRQEETAQETTEETGTCGGQLTWTLSGGHSLSAAMAAWVTIALVNRPGMAAGRRLLMLS